MNRQAKVSRKIIIPAIVALLSFVRNTVIEYQAKLFPFAKAFFGFCLVGLLLVSCASGPRRSGNLWNANTDKGRLNYFGASTVDGQNILQYWFEDQKSKQFGYQLPHGHHNVEISTTWSNGFEDSTQLPLDVKDGSKYAVYAYELQEGQDPNAVVALTRNNQESTTEKTFKDIGTTALGMAAYTTLLVVSPYVVVYGSPIWVPYVAYTRYQDKKKLKEDSKGPQDAAAGTEGHPADIKNDASAQPTGSQPIAEAKPEEIDVAAVIQAIEQPPAPTTRPFDGCCYVWIEDFETREVVAGTRP